MPSVALAYSGKLDTAICVYYLKHIKGMKVYTFSANLGQPEYLEPLAEQAVDLGAKAALLADLREKFAQQFLFPCLRANAVYEQGYHLFSALSRPLIIEELVTIARDEGCDYIAHGGRGTGNDKIRIENCIQALAPDLSVITPLEELGLKSPAQDLEYARQHEIRFESERATLLNIEQNLWGCNIQMRNSGDTWEEAPKDSYLLTVPPTEAPQRPVSLVIGFEKGTPVSVDGETLPPVKLIEKLNKIAGRCAIGRFDVIENRLLGTKTREIYEAPAAAVLYAALRALSSATLDREIMHFKGPLSFKYADLVYEGRWFSPFREALDLFFHRINERVDGEVRLNLYKGSMTISGLRSPHCQIVAPPGGAKAPVAPTRV